MGIVTVVPIIPHYKNVIFWYFNGRHIIRKWFGGEVFCPDETINDKLTVNHLDKVTCHRNYPFDKNLSSAETLLLQNFGSLENDDVIKTGLPEEIRNLLGDNTVANVEGWIHGK